MKVSVCLSAYNVERWIEEAIQSVLDQTFTDFELLICENGSVDRTRQHIEQFTDPRIKIFYNNINQGSYNGYRVLLDAAQGDYIAMLGGDDILMPTSLAMRALTLDMRANLVAVFCQPEHIQSNGNHSQAITIGNSVRMFRIATAINGGGASAKLTILIFRNLCIAVRFLRR